MGKSIGKLKHFKLLLRTSVTHIKKLKVTSTSGQDGVRETTFALLHETTEDLDKIHEILWVS